MNQRWEFQASNVGHGRLFSSFKKIWVLELLIMKTGKKNYKGAWANPMDHEIDEHDGIEFLTRENPEIFVHNDE